MKIVGYTIANNSLAGFKVEYAYTKEYISQVDSMYNKNATSILTVHLVFPGHTMELTEYYKDQKPASYEADVAQQLVTYLSNTLKEIHGQDHTINTRN